MIFSLTLCYKFLAHWQPSPRESVSVVVLSCAPRICMEIFRRVLVDTVICCTLEDGNWEGSFVVI